MHGNSLQRIDQMREQGASHYAIRRARSALDQLVGPEERHDAPR